MGLCQSQSTIDTFDRSTIDTFDYMTLTSHQKFLYDKVFTTAILSEVFENFIQNRKKEICIELVVELSFPYNPHSSNEVKHVEIVNIPLNKWEKGECIDIARYTKRYRGLCHFYTVRDYTITGVYFKSRDGKYKIYKKQQEGEGAIVKEILQFKENYNNDMI